MRNLLSPLDIFYGIHDDVTDQEQSHTDEVLIYIPGYVGHTMQKKCTCSMYSKTLFQKSS